MEAEGTLTTTVGKGLATLVEYVVQVREDDNESTDFVWRDFTTVSAKPRTKRKTIIRTALTQVQSLRPSGPDDDPLVVRVLGPEDARAFKVSAVVRDPELRIEGA